MSSSVAGGGNGDDDEALQASSDLEGTYQLTSFTLASWDKIQGKLDPRLHGLDSVKCSASRARSPSMKLPESSCVVSSNCASMRVDVSS
jgi:hypothetical protein